MQLNTADTFAAPTRDGGPIGQRTASLLPGATQQGDDRFDTTLAQINAPQLFKEVWDADSATLAGEAAWSDVNLPPRARAGYKRGYP